MAEDCWWAGQPDSQTGDTVVIFLNENLPLLLKQSEEKPKLRQFKAAAATSSAGDD